jgi:hypothetical protein
MSKKNTATSRVERHEDPRRLRLSSSARSLSAIR